MQHRVTGTTMPVLEFALDPSAKRHVGYAETVRWKLQDAGFRVELDNRNEKMNAKIRDFTLQKVPYVLVMGDKEEATCAGSVRARGKGDQGSTPLDDFISRAKGLTEEKSPAL